MVSINLTAFLVAATCSLGAYAAAASRNKAASPWSTLPPTPKLPGNPKGTKTTINGVEIWHAEFGTKESSKLPVIMLHSGLGNSDYWGSVIELAMKKHYVIVMDTRGQGRSTTDTKPPSFEVYASDAGELLKSLHIKKAAWVGWSEGANTILAALMDEKLAPMVDRAFTIGAWHHVAAQNVAYTRSPIYGEFMKRASAEYKTHQPSGNFMALLTKSTILKSTRPGSRQDQTRVQSDAYYIKNSKRVVMRGVSHFAPLQDPVQFAAKLEAFLS
ncbi:unnamed protein product [Rhizoctonia solani]|uniref:AB hydrolase-1 domain-containing protein n=1 Tax=Rhizoctonia solani TaxID=456999 RepID=A0A8H3CKQ0_9AGAM|nr:unnamed protein product [Rhizoctonia solani]